MRSARAAAISDRALQVPAPVIAAALGFGHTTTQRRRTLEPVRRALMRCPVPAGMPAGARQGPRVTV
jgi:hypothetical protein